VYLLKVVPAQPGGFVKLQFHRALTGNSSSPLCVMFSADSEFIVSNSKDTQILYWRTRDGSRQQTTSAFRDTQWQAPWTCILGWPVIGLWGDPSYDGTDVKSVCQGFAPHDDYFAAGDDNGVVKLLRFPSPQVTPPYQEHGGHGAMVTRVRFSRGNVLASLGGDDHCISLWSLAPVAPRESAARLAGRVVHPWAEVAEGEDFGGADDRYGLLGQAPPEERSMAPPRRPLRPSGQDAGRRHSADRGGEAFPPFQVDAAGPPWSQAADPWERAAAAGPEERQGQRRSLSAAAGRGSREARPGGGGWEELQQHLRAPPPSLPAAGARPTSAGPSRHTPGGSVWMNNQSGGVGGALRWS